MSLTLWSGVNPENARTHKLLAAAALANVAVTLKACGVRPRERDGGGTAATAARAAATPCCRRRRAACSSPTPSCATSRALTGAAASCTAARRWRAARWTCGSTFRQRSWTLPPNRLCTTAFRGEPLPANAMDRVHEVLRALEAWLETRTSRGRAHDGCGRGGCVCAAMALPSERRGGRGTDEEVPERVPPVQHGDAAARRRWRCCGRRVRTFGPVKAERKGKDAAAPARAEKKPKAAAAAADVRRKRTRRRGRRRSRTRWTSCRRALSCWTHSSASTATRTPARLLRRTSSSTTTPPATRRSGAATSTTRTNKMQFMTANLIRGWFQRMEHVRKYAFGVATHHWGGEAARHCGAVGVPRAGACRRLWRTWRTRSCSTGRRSLTSRRSGSASRTTCAGRAPTIPRPVLEGRVFK
ncbi:hypothetical protein TcYC6_0033460 [Trypanosoma cruzi]|nr:hypothetical protein TcYC6_0033460 [Trypanosoma cruzi]